MKYAGLLALLVTSCLGAEFQVPNASFEALRQAQGGEAAGDGAAGWKWWSRTKSGSAVRAADEHHSLGHSMCVRHDGPRDWALSSEGRFAAKPGEYYRASAWMKVKKGGVTLAVVALGGGKTLSWDIGSAGTGADDKWVELEALAEVPEGCDQVYLRFVGDGDTLAWVDDVGMQPTAPPKPVEKPKVEGYAKERVRERLDRSLVATPTQGGKVYLSWRLLDTDPSDAAFDVLRSSPGSQPAKLNAEPIRKTTDFADATAVSDTDPTYSVRPSQVTGQGEEAGVTVRTIEAGANFRGIRLQGDYTVQKAGIADLDGDGRLDFVLKQPSDNIDPASDFWKRSPDTYKLEAYSGDGKFLWRYDLGWAIERGIWYSPYVVYDLDGDGKAEVAAKTGEGNPRDADGRVQAGPEYLTILSGETGKPITRTDWPSREPFIKRPNGYNYASRNQLGVAYLDGKTPCLIVERGTYNLIVVVAYEFHDGKLRELWRWSNEKEPRRYWGQGAHWMHAADVDADGRDEVVIGSCVIDDNGVSLWSTGLGHPDHCYVGDIDPSRPGLEIYYGVEPGGPKNKMCLADAATGKILWGINRPTRHVHHCGLCSDIDPRYPGAECYSADTNEQKHFAWGLLHTAKGEAIEAENLRGMGPRAVYWDADLQRELLDGAKIIKFRGSPLPPKIEGNLVAVADVAGDWREEIVTSVPGELRIYSTTVPATDRRVCLMRDPIYRMDVAVAAMGYYQVPMLSVDLASQKR